MKKNCKKLTRMNNATSPATPASVWDNVIPGKCGKTTNYDPTKTDSEIRRMIHGSKED